MENDKVRVVCDQHTFCTILTLVPDTSTVSALISVLQRKNNWKQNSWDNQNALTFFFLAAKS
jgi:hypothetical protein